MKKAFLIIILLLPSVSAATLRASSWDKAVEIYSRSEELKPHRMSTSSQTYDGRGRLEKTEEIVYRLDYSFDTDNPEREVVSAIEDGKDITEKKQKELEKGNGRAGGPPGEMEGMDKMPLDPEVQNDVLSAFSGRMEYKNGTRCEVWNFEIMLNDTYNGEGTAWLNPDTGAAVSMEYRIEPLFPFVEEMLIGMDFKANIDKQWVLDKLKMNGRVNMLIMKKSFDSVTSFSDYR